MAANPSSSKKRPGPTADERNFPTGDETRPANLNPQGPLIPDLDHEPPPRLTNAQVQENPHHQKPSRIPKTD